MPLPKQVRSFFGEMKTVLYGIIWTQIFMVFAPLGAAAWTLRKVLFRMWPHFDLVLYGIVAGYLLNELIWQIRRIRKWIVSEDAIKNPTSSFTKMRLQEIDARWIWAYGGFDPDVPIKAQILRLSFHCPQCKAELQDVKDYRFANESIELQCLNCDRYYIIPDTLPLFLNRVYSLIESMSLSKIE